MKRSFHEFSGSSVNKAPQKKPRELQDRHDSDDEAPQAPEDPGLGGQGREPVARALRTALTKKITEEMPALAKDALFRSVCEVLPDFAFEAWAEVVEKFQPVAGEHFWADGVVTVDYLDGRVWPLQFRMSCRLAKQLSLPKAVRAAMAGPIPDTWVDYIEMDLAKLVPAVLSENEQRFRAEMLCDDLGEYIDGLHKAFTDAITEEMLQEFISAIYSVVAEKTFRECPDEDGNEVIASEVSDHLTENTHKEMAEAIARVAETNLPLLERTATSVLCRGVEEVLSGDFDSSDTESAGRFSDNKTALSCDEMMEELTLNEDEDGVDAGGQHREQETGDANV